MSHALCVRLAAGSSTLYAPHIRGSVWLMANIVLGSHKDKNLSSCYGVSVGHEYLLRHCVLKIDEVAGGRSSWVVAEPSAVDEPESSW